MITARSTEIAFVVVAKNSRSRRHVSRPQVSIADWRDNQISNQGISISQCLLDAASICSVGDVEFRSDFLLGQDEYAIPTNWFAQNR